MKKVTIRGRLSAVADSGNQQSPDPDLSRRTHSPGFDGRAAGLGAMRRSDRLTGSKRPNGSSAAGVTDAANQPRPNVTDLPGAAGLPGMTGQPSVGDDALVSTAVQTSAAEPEARNGYRFVDRRALLRLAGTAAIAAPATGLLAACSGSKGSGGVRPVRIGIVTPQSGALSSFSKTD